MTTKGPGNRYGYTRGGRQGHATDKIGFAWARDFNKKTLVDHFNRHGEQMKSSTKEDYIAHAVSFANHIDKKNCVSFVDKNHTTYKYNKKNNILAIIKSNGIVITYFSPKEEYKYYMLQYKKYSKKGNKK